MKQDVTVCDATGSARLTLWANEIGKIEEGNSYLLSGMVVREFRGWKLIHFIEDIGK